MQDQFSESKSTKKKILRRVWFWILVGLVVVGTLFFIMLPVGIDYGIEHYLKNQGADEVTLENVNFNPFTGRLTLNGMRVKIGTQTTLKIPEATFIIEWSAFIHKRFVLERFNISDTELIIKELSDGRWQIGGINLPDQKETSEPSSWNFGLQQLTVNNSKIKFISSQFTSDLKIEQAKISKLSSWMPERKARLEFEGQLNEGKLQLQMDISPFGNDLMAAGRIKLKGLSLAPFAQLLKPRLKSLEGRLDADLNIETRQISDTGFSHYQKGRLNLHQARMQIEDTDFSNNSLDWDGAVRIDIPKTAETLKIAANGRLNGSQLAMVSQNEDPQIQQDGLNWEGKVNYEQTPAAVNLNADSALTLQNTRVNAPDVKLVEQKLTWKGTVQLSSTEKAGEQRIIANGNLASGPLTINLLQKKLNLTHAGLDWQGKFDYAREKAGININTDGQMGLLDVKMDSPELKLAEEKLTLNGTFQFSSTAETKGQRIIADGMLDSSHLLVRLPQQKIDFEHAGLDWQGKFEHAQEKNNQNINADGQMNLLAVKMKSPELNLAEEKLTWKGALQFSSTAEAKGQRIIADGSLDGSRLLVSLLSGKLKFEHKGLSWKGRLDSGEKNDFNSLKVDADLILKDIDIHHPETNQNLLNANAVSLQAIEVKGIDDVRVSDVTFNGLDLVTAVNAEKSSSAPKPLFSTQKLTIQNIQLTKSKDLSIAAVKLKDLRAALHRNNKGQLSAINRLKTIRTDLFSSDPKKQTAAKHQAKPKPASKKEPTDFGFRIGQLEITGNNLVRFEDESVDPAFGIDLKILEARLSNLDTSRPAQSASVKLLVSDGENARLSLDGTIQPFAERLSLDWVGKIESLELPPLSPYVIQNTGYSFISGEMRADIPLKITQNELKGAIDLTLYNPKVKSVKAPDPEKGEKGKIQLNMPLDSALKLLRNKQNNVKLNIPISGDISDPKFSVADSVNKVLAQTLQTSALSYLKFMLGPYGIGISLAEMAVEHASKIRLNPILFEPGSADLDEAANDYMQRVAAILKEHPVVQVSVCGVATERDRAALSGTPSAEAGAQPTAPKGDKGDKDKTRSQKKPAASASTDAALLALAKKRTKRIEDQLVNAHGIAVKRIIGCKSEIDKSAEAKPRVDLAI
jgi:hypothetical protein